MKAILGRVLRRAGQGTEFSERLRIACARVTGSLPEGELQTGHAGQQALRVGGADAGLGSKEWAGRGWHYQLKPTTTPPRCSVIVVWGS